jgi:hypothetical protein
MEWRLVGRGIEIHRGALAPLDGALDDRRMLGKATTLFSQRFWAGDMSTIHVRAEISRDALLRAIEQLSSSELDQLMAELRNLRAVRGHSRLTEAESTLLTRINEALPSELDRRYSELIGRRQEELLTTEEHEELLRLTDEVERIEADRVQALAELANVRGVSLSTVMRDLGIPAPAHG